jgi:hypothetical protein
MPKERKSRAARVANLQVARDTLSTKRRRSTGTVTPADSDLSDKGEESTSDNEIVCLLKKFKVTTSTYIILQMEQPVIIEQADASDIATRSTQAGSGGSQITFRVAVKKGSLSTASSRGSLYLEWSIITDPTDIDGPEDSDDINDSEIASETGPATFASGSEENDISSGSHHPISMKIFNNMKNYTTESSY